MQITGQSSVGISNTTFIGNIDGNSQGGAFAVAQGGLIQVCFHHLVPKPSRSACLHGMWQHAWLAISEERPNHLTGCLQVVNSRFAANSASRGGAIYSEGASVTILNSQFTGNVATTTGGAMYVAEQSALTILNSTFSGNIAGAIAQCTSSAFFLCVYCWSLLCQHRCLGALFTVKHRLIGCGQLEIARAPGTVIARGKAQPHGT